MRKEAVFATRPSADDAAEIGQLSELWVAAVAKGDLVVLGRLLADDVVIVHGNGRQIAGKDAVLKDLEDSLSRFAVEQTPSHEETVVAGAWAFDRATVHTKITPRAGGTAKTYESRTLTLMRRSPTGSWRIARVIGVVVQPAAP